MTIKNHFLPLLIGILFLIAGFCLYGSAGHDDSHITFWASYTLSEFGEILNYNGDRIEQSSSLLQTLLTAFFAFIFQADVVTVGYLITHLAGAVAIFLTWQLLEKGGQSNISEKPKCYSDPLFPILLLASSPAFMLWNTSGMESTLAAACLLWFVLCWGALLNGQQAVNTRSLTLASFATFALISVRPEMISLAAATVFLLFIWRRVSGTRGNLPILLFYSTVLLSIALLAVWRYFYFGSPMPLPVYAKVSPLSEEKIYFGTIYLLRYSMANPVFLVGLIAALIYLARVIWKKTNGTEIHHAALLSAFILLAYTAFIWVSGGDWMQAGRFLVPVLPLAAIFCGELFKTLPKKFVIPLVAALLLLNLYSHYEVLKQQSHGTPLWASFHILEKHQQQYSIFEQYNQEHLRDLDVIDKLDETISQLIEKRGAPVTLLSGQSGMVFYYTAKKYFRQIVFYDNRGLVEKSLLKCKHLDDIPRSSQGLYFDLDGFFARQPGLYDDCGIPEPDILYDINDLSRQLPQRMSEQSYTLIHKEGGKMLKPSTSLPVNALPAVNFVMVANDLMDELGNPSPTITRYHEKPLVKR